MNKRIKEIINEWDPIELFPMAPKDEYSAEVLRIEETLLSNANITEEELAQIINGVFTNSFGRDVFTKSMDDCFQVAKKILN